MAKGRQTKTVARIQLTGAVVDIHGRKFIQWSTTKPIDPTQEKLVMHTTYNGNMPSAVAEVQEWLGKHFAGVE